MPAPDVPHYDLVIAGGGINGTGIARDAAGRGLKVLLVEKDDLASHTSSGRTKLIHGGLRYLAYYEFRLASRAPAAPEIPLPGVPHTLAPLQFAPPRQPSPTTTWMMRARRLL